MTTLDIRVVADPQKRFQDGVTFKYEPINPADPISKFLDTNTGDITLPIGSATITLRFHLAPTRLMWVDKPGETFDIDFALSSIPDGDKSLAIRAANSPGQPRPDQVFSKPVLSASAHPAPGPAKPHTAIETTVRQNDGKGYTYCLSIGATDRSGHRTPFKVDPKIRNGGTGRTFFPRILWPLGLIGVALVVYGLLRLSGILS